VTTQSESRGKTARKKVNTKKKARERKKKRGTAGNVDYKKNDHNPKSCEKRPRGPTNRGKEKRGKTNDGTKVEGGGAHFEKPHSRWGGELE